MQYKFYKWLREVSEGFPLRTNAPNPFLPY